MNRLKVGIAGCGLIATKRHIPAFGRMHKSSSLRAVCDVNSELARQVATSYDIPAAYSGLDEMLKKESLDVVDVCVPPHFHAPLAIQALDSGCHVLLEKPMALSSTDCDRILAAARQNDARLCVVHGNLFHPPFSHAKELVDEGSIGEFREIRMFLSTPRHEMLDLENHWYHQLPGGVLGETGPHIAYMSLSFLKHVKRAYVIPTDNSKRPWAPYDEFGIYLEGERGTSVATVCYGSDYWAALVDLVGTSGVLSVDLERMTLVQRRLLALNYHSIAESSMRILGQELAGLSWNAVLSLTRRRKLGTDIIVEKFLRSIANGGSVPVSGEEGREAVRVMEMIVAAVGRPVTP